MITHHKDMMDRWFYFTRQNEGHIPDNDVECDNGIICLVAEFQEKENYFPPDACELDMPKGTHTH